MPPAFAWHTGSASRIHFEGNRARRNLSQPSAPDVKENEKESVNKPITIRLSEPMFEELIIAAADSAELDETRQLSVEQFATECIESVLASRRLERITA
jgi:hypothetical protein